MSNVEFYTEIGNGRENANYQTTTTFKGRMKNTIEFVAAKTVDKIRIDEMTHGLEIQNQLDHENITHFINWFQSDSKLVVILEYCPGGTLIDLLDRDVYLPESVIRIFCADILSALLYLHINSFLFRDFDPHNILLDENGILKLNDFTGAGTIGEKMDTSHVSPDYFCLLPPELLSDDGVPSFASDFYSLGCLMYKMATGFTPFDNDEPENTLENIRTLEPIPISICSDEFNDLVLKMLNKDPYKRPTWAEIVHHPFWENSLDNEVFDGIEHRAFPPQLEFEEMRPKRRSVSSHSFRLSQSLSLSFRQSCSLQRERKEAKTRAEVEAAKPQQKLTLIEKIRDATLKSPLLKPVPIIFNATIEVIEMQDDERTPIPLDSSMLHAETSEAFERAAEKIRGAFSGIDRAKGKVPILTFVTQQAKSNDVANNFANSPFFVQILEYAKQTKHPQLSVSFLLLFATVIRYATDIPNASLTSEKLAILEDLSMSQSAIVERKAVAALGELVTFISQKKEDVKFPSFATKVLIDALNSQDDVTRHYAMRTIANIITTKRFEEIFDAATLETILMNISFSETPSLFESYSIALAALYQKIKPASIEFVTKFSQALIARQNPNLQICAIIIAVETESLLAIKEDLLNNFRSAVGEQKIKSLLAICLIADKSPEFMIEISARFFASFERVQAELPNLYDSVVNWSAEKCSEILEQVIQGKPLELLQIPLDAVSNKPLAAKIWTQGFGKKIQILAEENNFSAPNCELILQIIQQGIAFGVCDVSIVADLNRALISTKENVRFSVVKVIADACEISVTDVIIEFTEHTIIPLAISLLQDSLIIPDQTLRILSKVTASAPSLIHLLEKPQMMALIFQRAVENESAIELTTRIVKEGSVKMEDLVSARLIPCVMSTMDRSTGANEILLETLLLAEKQLQEMSVVAQKKLVKSISTLAAKAPICAATLLENELSAKCFNLMVKVFTPHGTQTEIFIESAFGPFSISLTNGYKKQECCDTLCDAIKSLQLSATSSQAMRLRIKGATTLVSALKKASSQSPSPLKETAAAALKALRG